MPYFFRNGVKNLTEDKIIAHLKIQKSEFLQIFRDKEDFLRQAVNYDLEEQKKQDASIKSQAGNAVAEVILLFWHYTKRIADIHPGYFVQVQYLYPQVWRIYTRHAQMHGYYQFYDLINAGIARQLFRRNINIEIVTKVLIEQINVMHNTHLFPKHRYDLAEVFRTIFLYYLKGICTEQGSRLADQVFADSNFAEGPVLT